LKLCPHHARLLEKQHQRHSDNLASELLRNVEDFSTPEAVNALLGNLVRQLARKRIARLDAMAIAYVSQLLLGSISSIDRHDAALRNADNLDAGFGPMIFDRPYSDPTPGSPSTNETSTSDSAPISDTARIAAIYTAASAIAPETKGGRS
jgi:hypothetical protein